MLQGEPHLDLAQEAPVSETVRIALIAIVAVAAARLIVPRVPVVGPTVGAYL